MDVFSLIRKIHGKLHYQKVVWQRQHNIQKSLRGMRVLVLGSPLHSNLGDSAILIAEIEFILKSGIPQKKILEIAFPQYYEYQDEYSKLTKKSCPIFGLGGGNMGNQWKIEEQFRYDLLDAFPNNPITIFPQTIYYLPNSEDDIKKSISYYNGRKGLTLVAREKLSEETMKRLYPNTPVLLTPDIVLSSTMEDFGAVEQERKGALLCVRSDAEKSVDNAVWNELEQAISNMSQAVVRTDMHSDCEVTKENRKECVRKKMQEFCGAELVITDRLHGMIFAAITGTPCIVFSNYNHKVKGTYEWISYLPYIRYVETIEEAKMVIPELLAMKDCKYDNAPLKPYFDKLAEVVRDKCNKWKVRQSL